MTYAFTSQEISDLLEAQRTSTAVTLGDQVNYVSFYTKLSEIIKFHLDNDTNLDSDTRGALNSASLWVSSAIGANGNYGIQNAFIRAFTNREGELRLGRAFSDTELQRASNAVAENLISDLRLGNDEYGATPWTVPSIAQIAGADASAIGAALYQGRVDGLDSALVNNAGWSGVLGFSLLGGSPPYETWRLIASGDTGSENIGEHERAQVNTLEDFKNVLFAVDAYNQALQSAYTVGVLDFVPAEYNQAIAALLGIQLLPDAGYETQFRIAASSGQWLGLISGVAARTPAISEIVSLIASVGPDQALRWIESALIGEPVAPANTDFVANAQRVFGGIPINQQQGIGFAYKNADQLVLEARGDGDAALSARHALLGLSPFAVTGIDFSDQDLSLYDPVTGEGALTEGWLTDRAALLALRAAVIGLPVAPTTDETFTSNAIGFVDAIGTRGQNWADQIVLDSSPGANDPIYTLRSGAQQC